MWNEGARQLYGYDPQELVGNAGFDILHTLEDVQARKDHEIMAFALHKGK